MGNRLSKIYTRTGDQGTTGLGDGARVDKDDARVEAYGTVDELNSVIGMILALDVKSSIRDTLTAVQHDLFDLGGELCMPGYELVKEGSVERLEQQLDELNANLKPLKDFILPGGSMAAATCHLARTVCRRAERRVVTLSAQAEIRPITVQYLNRLSDLLFVVARYQAEQSGEGTKLWNEDRPQ